MLSLTGSKPTLAALSTLLVGTGLGLLPVGRFIVPAETPICPPPANTTASATHARVGPIALDAYLSQSVLQRNADGTVFVDVKLAADADDSVESPRRPIDCALVLDVSGSMADENKIGLMKQACHAFAGKLSP